MAMVRGRVATLAVIAAIGATVVAGCGSKSSGGKSTVSPASGGTTTSSPAPSPSSSSGSGGGYGY
jgi:hypothetical protein